MVKIVIPENSIHLIKYGKIVIPENSIHLTKYGKNCDSSDYNKLKYNQYLFLYYTLL